MVYKLLDKTDLLEQSKKKLSLIKNWKRLHKSIIKNFEKTKLHSLFMDNIWGADLADMQLISKFNKEIRFLLCVIDIFSKYAWVIPLKYKRGILITNAFQKILDEPIRKPNKM